MRLFKKMNKDVLLISLQKDLDVIGLRSLHYQLLTHGFASHILFIPRFSSAAMSDAIYNLVDKLSPLFIGISLLSIEYDRAKELTHALKSHYPSIPILWGGIHPTVAPEACLDYADFICIGEGENFIVDFANAVTNGSSLETLGSLVFRRNGQVIQNSLYPLMTDLSAIPACEHVPRDSYLLRKGTITPLNIRIFRKYARYSGTTYSIMSSRGCPFSCTYCCNRSSLFSPVKVNMKHRSVTHNFMLLPIPNLLAEQAQLPAFSVFGAKRVTLPDLLLSLASSSNRANILRHQSGQHKLSLDSFFPSENAGLPWSGAYSLPAIFLEDLSSGYSCDALPGILTRKVHLQGFPQNTPSPTENHRETARLYPWLSLGLPDSFSRKRRNESAFLSWSGYPSVICLRYSSSCAPGTVESKNKENIPGAFSLSRNYHQRLPKEAHSSLAVSSPQQKFSSSRNFRVLLGQYAKEPFSLLRLCPKQPKRLPFYRCPAEEQDNVRQGKDKGSYNLTDPASATGQNQSKFSCLTLILLNEILYSRPDFLAMPAQYHEWRGLLYKELESTSLDSRFYVATTLILPSEKEILFLWFAEAQPEFFLHPTRLLPAHNHYDSPFAGGRLFYNGLFLKTRLPLLPMPVVTSVALRLEPYRRGCSFLQKYFEKILAPYACSVVSYSSAHHPFCPTRGIGLISAVFYRLKERCAIFICNGLNSWPLIFRYSHILNSNHTKPLPFQDYFYRYYKTFPCNNALAKIYGSKKVRFMELSSVIDELRMAIIQYPFIECINFQDDCFLLRSDEEIERFCHLYKQEIKLPFIARSIPTFITERKIALMKSAGLAWISIGLQSGSDHICYEIYKRRSGKQDFLKAARAIKNQDLAVLYDVILDNPFETDEDRIDTVLILMETPKPFYTQCFSLNLYPGTELQRRALEEGLIKGDEYQSKDYLLYNKTSINNLIRVATFIPSSWSKVLLELFRLKPASLWFKMNLSVARLFAIAFIEPITYLRIIRLSQRKKLGATIRVLPHYVKEGLSRFRKHFG